MSTRRLSPLAAVLALAGVVVAVAGTDKSTATSRPRAAKTSVGDKARSSVARLTRVTELKHVCMVNDQYMGRDQIPVEVEGRTYYGCCAMCKERLAKDAAARKAVDPVTGKTVDKARAVIGRAEDGKVAYFENGENLDRYNKRQ